MVTVNELLNVAREKKASDLHLTVGLPPKMRVDGELINMNYPKLTPPDIESIALGLMNEKQRDIFTKDGELDFAFSVPQVGRFRTNVFRQRGSVALCMRLVGTVVPEPETLGVPSSVVELYKKKRGLVLVTGPTGSGKSTTLYTALSELNSEHVNIVTVEDPVEANIQGINQVQVNVKADMTFASALRSILRQDPDIIMIGEIRDEETANIAVTASITGHLVVSTLHTNSAAASITRLADMGLDNYLIADSMVGVIAQRLARRLCVCKKPKQANEFEKRLIRVPENENVTIYEPCGCAQCGNTGYRGRIGVYEMMTITKKIKNVISAKGTTEDIEKMAVHDGMRTLHDSAARLVREGITSMGELRRIVYSNDEDM